MSINRRHLIASALASLPFATSAKAQDPISLKLSHWLPAQHPMAVYLQNWADDLGEATQGRLNIEVFPAGQLGPVPEHYDMVRRGVVDIGFILHGSTSDRFPLTSLIDLPFMVDSAAHGTKILNDPEVRSVLDSEHRGLHVLYLLTHQPGQILTVEKGINTPADLQGLRIRFPSATAKAFLEKLGASSIGLPPSAIAENVQKKVIDGVMIDYGGAGIAYKLGGSINHVLELNSYVTSFGLVMNPDSYAAIPGDLRQILDASVTGVEAEIAANWDNLDAPGKAALAAGGAEIVVPTEDQRALFEAAGAATSAAILSAREDLTKNIRSVHQLMLATADKYRSQ